MITACGIVAVAASADESVMEAASFPCCSGHRGTAARVLEFEKHGEDCTSTVQTYCPECGTIFDTWEGIFCPCPHNH